MEKSTPETNPEQSSASAANNTPLMILIVDDEPAHLKLAKRALSQALKNVSCCEANSFQTAKNQLQTQAKLISLALVDFNLGETSGLDVLKYIRHEHSQTDIPVVMISTSSLDSDVDSSYANGANCYLVKNSEPAQYQKEIQQAVAFFLHKS